jgi:hypothetical protein
VCTQAILEKFGEVEKQLAQVSAAIETLIRDKSSKEQMLQRHHHEWDAQRNLFVWFFLQPQRLQTIVGELRQRVAAMGADRDQ